MNKKATICQKKDMLIKIRSKYIVIKIFENLEQSKLLNIARYNKKYQKLMHKKIKDYKDEYSKIKIEIIPKENTYGEFIHFISNTQVYFNDNNEVIKRKFITKDDNVTKIKIIINQKIQSLSKLFYRCKCINKIKFIQFNRDDIYDMSWMFRGCSSLQEVNFTNFNTNNVINMNRMFYGCSSVKELDFSNFNTNNVIDMNNMFSK